MNEKIVDLALNIYHFNQDVMKLNIKYSEEIERLNNIIKEVREYLKVREYETKCCEVCDTMSNRILEILNKGE